MPRTKTKTRASAPQQGALDLSARHGDAGRTYEPFVPGPNPKLPAFIQQHATPYNPATDRYDVPAFERDLVVDKAAPPKAIYDMHSYWSKKHWAAIREYIRHYLPERHYPRGTGLVLDSFSGSGMTGVAALMEDRPCVLVDASPAAAFISHCYTHPVDPEALQLAYERMLHEPYPAELMAKLRQVTGEDIETLQQELDWLYATKCDRCGGEAVTDYIVYSQRFQCPNCADVVPLFDCPQEKVPFPVGGRRAGKTELKSKPVCPQCLARSHGRPSRDFVISTRTPSFGSVPVLVHYQCLGNCRPKASERRHNDDQRTKKGRYFSQFDKAKLDLIERAEVPHWYPGNDMIAGWETRHKRRLDRQGVIKTADLYTKRNLWAQAAMVAAISRLSERPLAQRLMLGVTGSTLHLSKMSHHKEGGGGISVGTYYLPQLCRERYALKNIPDKLQEVRRAQGALLPLMQREAIVSQERAATANLKSECLDFVFIDPPYVDKLQYGELNFVWESWLGFDGQWLEDEVVVNPYRQKTLDDWDRDLREVLANVHRALKPGRWMSLCYHDTDPGTWARVQDMLLDAGFEIHTVTVLDPLQKSSNQLTAEKVAKGDLVVNCRKPRPGEGGAAGRDETALVSQRVRDLLIEVLSQTAGQTRDGLWDLVLKRLLSRGQLAAHRFDDILAEVAFRSESGRWFLKEEFEVLSDNDLRNEEHAGEALIGFARLRMSGVPATLAAQVVVQTPDLAVDGIDDDAIESHIKRHLLKGAAAEKFKLGGRMKGVEFYDCLFFYLTRWLKGRGGGKTPRRNLAEFLDEYLVRFKDGDKWLYRLPDAAEAEALRKARQTGLGRRIRQYVAYLSGQGDFPAEKRPDLRTLYIWLKHAATFGLPEEGVVLFEKGGLGAQLTQLPEELRWDAEEYYATCRRRAGRSAVANSEAEDDEPQDEGDDE